MRFQLLASGSKGNCCVISHQDATIVIDCGTTKTYLKKCFQQLKVNVEHVDALLITHSHRDHISALSLFKDIKTYSVKELNSNTHFVTPFERFYIKDFMVEVLPMSHDSDDCVGYVIHTQNEKLVYITDTGYIREDVKAYIQNADYYIFESNHDLEMLMDTNRPLYIKQRIAGDCGHLCNENSANILSEVISNKTKEIVLAHISEEANTIEQAIYVLNETLRRKAIDTSQVKIHGALQYGIYQGGIKHD